MNAHNQNLNTNGAEPVKPSIPMLAAEHLGTSYVEMLLQEFKAAPDVWQKLPESKQHEIIERARENAAYAIGGMVNTVMTQGHTALAGTVESINLKDKIKLTVIIAKGNASESLMELYEAGSESPCQIMLGNAEQYLGGMELITAEPSQRDLFSEPETPEDSLLWAINIPILSGNSVVPCPNRKDAELYARSIRNKFLEDENEANQDYAKLVYAMPWTESPGAHNRSMAKGNWEAMLNWFSKLCRGEVVVEPIALLEFVPEAEPDDDVREINFDEAAAEINAPLIPESADFYDDADDYYDGDPNLEMQDFNTPESAQEVTPAQLTGEIIITVRVKSDAFVAECLGHQAKSKFGVEAAIDLLIGKLDLVSGAKTVEITNADDEAAQVRRFKIAADQE